MRTRLSAVLVTALVVALTAAVLPAQAMGQGRTFVLAGEGNRLRVYHAPSPQNVNRVLIPSVSDDPAVGRDINAQICTHDFDGDTYFIAGEDSAQGGAGSPGWGWFKLEGKALPNLTWEQQGKLRPTWSPHADGQAENYGCGFLDDGRLVTSDVGDQLPHEDASGQLLVWFPDAAGGFADGTVPGGDWQNVDNSLDQNYCKIDTTIGTAGGVWVHDGWVYVASNRPGPNGPGGIYRYESADFPADNGCAGFGNQADLVDEGVVTRELWLPSDPFVLTPSALVPSGRTLLGKDTWYVSSVFTGIIAEYVDLGPVRVHVRNVVEPPGGAPIGQVDVPGVNDGGTPFGLGVAPDGDLWYADLGIVGPGPFPGLGSVQRVEFGDAPLHAPSRTVVQDGLDFADGIGIVEL